MAFIREKQVKKYRYAYLVENEWVDGEAKQSVKEYLGRVYDVPPAPPPEIPSDTAPEEVVAALVERELAHLEEPIEIDIENNSVSKNTKDVALALNGGYLCTHTLRQLEEAKKSPDGERPGQALARAFSDAGLRIPRHAFIRFYKAVKP